MTSRDVSVEAASEGDTIDDSRLTLAEADDTASISDMPARTATPGSNKGTKRSRPVSKKPRSKKIIPANWPSADLEGTEDESAPTKIKRSGSEDPDVKAIGTAVGTRRQANGTVGSVYSGSKIRHIKKADGIPLWRKDIQYIFLREVVEDTTPCFTRISDGKKDCTFAEIYIDSMARSSKTSKILKDRLHIDQPAAQNMAMICLLVNVGRMNTTLNFFPEMRAQLRTYHPIPALQAYPTQKDYKSLQDAPRLKSILKGASEDEEQPRTLSQLRAASVPRTNPVNLIFVLSQAANEISQMHFIDKIDFFDLAIRPTISSRTRAVAFLWLMWWYLESDFTKEAALNNPFGTGEFKPTQDPANPEDLPLLVPKLNHISEEEGDLENKDPEEEIVFGERMTKERERFNAKTAEEEAALEHNGKDIEHKGIKKLKRSARDYGDDLDSSDVDSRGSPGFAARSPAPHDSLGHPQILQADSLEDEWETNDAHPGRGRYKRVKGKNTPSRSKPRPSEAGPGSIRGAGRSRLGINSDRGTPDTGRGTPQPPGVNHPILSQFPAVRSSRGDLYDTSQMSMVGMPSASKSRARTGYQRELEQHRQRRVDWLVRRRRRAALREQKERRESMAPSWLLRDMYRISQLQDLYDSEEDDSASSGLSLMGLEIPPHGTGLGGLIPLKTSKSNSGLNKEALESKEDKPPPDSADALAQTDTIPDGLEDIYGEEAENWKRVFTRTQRRLYTWSGDKDVAAFYSRKHAEEQRQAMPYLAASTRTRIDDGMLAPSSIANSTPRKPRHEARKSLEDEITNDLLAEKDSDEEDEEDDDGDTNMLTPPRGTLRT